MGRILLGLLLSFVLMWILACEFFITFGLWFAPGWANGWPAPLSIHVVWPSGMALIAFIILVTLGCGLGTILYLVLASDAHKSDSLERYYRRGLLTWSVVAFCAAALTWWSMHAAAWEMWPQGYPPPEQALTPRSGR
jgi:hypothetical protein